MAEINSMTLQFNVNNQTLTRTSNEQVVEHSVNYLYAQFTFNENWNEVDKKYLILRNDDMINRVQLNNENKALIPSAFVLHDILTLAVIGVDENNYVVITTNPVYLPIYKTIAPYGDDPFLKYIESNTLNVNQSGDTANIEIPNIYFKDSNLTNDILSFLGRDGVLLKAINMPYGLLNDLQITLNQSTYILTITGYDKNNNVLFTRTADFNIETKVFKNIYYDSQTQELVFVTMDDEEIRVPIGDILTGIATQTWVTANFVQKEIGKGLSANDFTNELKTKLDGIENGANVNVQVDWNEQDSSKDEFIKNKPSIPTKTSDLTNDSGFIDNTYHDNSKQDVIDSDHKLSADLVNDTNTTNKFVSVSEKAQITTNQNDITAIKDGQSIDSFSDVESAISNVTLSGDNTSVEINSKVISVKDTYVENFFATDQEVANMLEEVFE